MAHPPAIHSETPAQIAQPTRLSLAHTTAHPVRVVAVTPQAVRQPLKHEPKPKSSSGVRAQPHPFAGDFASFSVSFFDNLIVYTLRPNLLAMRSSSSWFMKTTPLFLWCRLLSNFD